MIINLHKAIDKSKVQFDYVIDHPGHLYYESVVKSLGGKIYKFPTFNGYNFFEIRKVWKQFFKNHPEYKILHSHVRSYASIYLPIAKKAGLKTVIHSHSTSNGNGLCSIVKRIMQYPLRWQADYFFGCSKEAGAWLFGNKVVNSPKYQILQNAIDTEQYKFDPKIRKEYREKLGLGDKKTFIHVGRFHPAKNHQFLLNVFAEIHKVDPNTVLLLAGDGELRSEIEMQIASLNLQNDVILLGSRSDVPKLLQAADIFIFPSAWEGLPVTVVEAQAAGLPCVCSDTIPKSVKITDLVEFLPLSYSAEIWANAIFKYSESYARINVQQKIIKAGYDIQSTAKWLENFYRAI